MEEGKYLYRIRNHHILASSLLSAAKAYCEHVGYVYKKAGEKYGIESQIFYYTEKGSEKKLAGNVAIICRPIEAP